MIISLLISLLIFSVSFGQTSKLNTQFEVGGLRGIQLSKTFPILKSGGLAQFSVSKSIGNFVQVGVGTGFLQLESEEFIPLFIQCNAHKKTIAIVLFLLPQLAMLKLDTMILKIPFSITTLEKCSSRLVLATIIKSMRNWDLQPA